MGPKLRLKSFSVSRKFETCWKGRENAKLLYLVIQKLPYLLIYVFLLYRGIVYFQRSISAAPLEHFGTPIAR